MLRKFRRRLGIAPPRAKQRGDEKPSAIQNQVWPKRTGPMRKLVARHFSEPVDALEIGSWYGVGSTKIWMETLPVGSRLTLIDAWRPFISVEDHRAHPNHLKAMDDEMRAAVGSTLDHVFEHEASPRVAIDVIRARSAEFLPRLRPEQFDFIYVDGSHYYDAVVADIRACKELVKSDFSIICGDDYELLQTRERLEIARRNMTRDTVEDGPNFFHPGVMLALAEEFGEVNAENGFWWIFRRNGDFTTS